MPDQPTWYERVPSILAHLRAREQPPFLDRPAMEMLFGLRRRSAISLMHRFGGYQVGKTFLVDRSGVVAALEALASGRGVEQAVTRKRRIVEELAGARQELAGRRIRIPMTGATWLAGFEGLPAGVSVEPGEVRILFDQPVHLLEKLLALAQAIANDYPEFEKRLGNL